MDDLMSPDELHRRIQANAVVATGAFRAATGGELLAAPAVAWLDAQVRALAAAKDASEPELRELESVWGVFFGECLLRALGGRWVLINDNWFGVVFGGVSADVDDAVCLRSLASQLAETGGAPARPFRHAGGDVIPIPSAFAVQRQGGSMIVNPWSVVSDALRGDAGASVRFVYDWIASQRPAAASLARQRPELARADWQELEGIQTNLSVAAYDFREDTGEEALFDLRTLAWIDATIQRFAASAPHTEQERLEFLAVLGAAFGECMRRGFGGEWIMHDEFAAIGIASRDVTLHPWRTVTRALLGEEGQSVVGMYNWAAKLGT